jgi:selenide,water dikinase
MAVTGAADPAALLRIDAGAVGEEDLLLLADAQSSGGLLAAGELPGAAVIGELVTRRDSALIIR